MDQPLKRRAGPRRHWTRRLARGIGWAFAGLLALVALVFVSLNLGPTRNFIRNQVNGALATTFRGTLLIDRIGWIHLDGLGGIDARVLDDRGKQVILLRGASAKSPWPELVWDLVRGRPLTLVLSEVNADHIEITLRDDGQGSPTLASAFLPRKPSPPSDSNEPGVTVLIPKIRARHVWAHGSLQALAGIDVELRSLAASFNLRPAAIELGVTEVGLLTRNLPSRVNPRGKLRAALTLPSAKGSKPKGFASFDGTVIEAPTTLRAEIDGDRVLAKVSAPAISPDALRAQVPSLTLSGPTALEVHAKGELPRIELDATVKNAAVGVELSGEVALRDTLTASADVKVAKLDAQALMATAPATNLDANLHASLTLPKSGPLGVEYRLEVASGSVQTQRTPALVVSGKLERKPEGELVTDGTLNVSEAGLSALGQYRFRLTREQQQLLNAKLAVDFKNPPRLERAAGVRASGRLEANADLDLGRQSVSAKVLLSGGPIEQGSNAVKSLDLRATAQGPLSAPVLEFQVLATGLSAADRHFPHANVVGRGNLKQLTVHARVERPPPSGEIDVDATLALGDAFAVLKPAIALKAGEDQVNVRAERVSFPGGQVKLERLEVDGAGTLAGNARVGAERIDAELTADKVDVGKILRLARIEAPIKRGFVSGDVKVTGTPRRLRGKIQLQTRELMLAHGDAGKLDIDLRIEDQRTSGSIAVMFGKSEINAEIGELKLPLENAGQATLNDVRGKLDVKGELELARVLPWLRAANVPLDEAKGTVTLELSAENPPEPGARPALSLHVKTKGLLLVENRAEPEQIETTGTAMAAQPLAISGVDIDATLSHEGRDGQTELGLKLTDQQGTLLDAAVETHLRELTKEAFAQFETLPFRAKLRIPERELDKLPSVVRPPSMQGAVSLNVDAEGSIGDPKLTAHGDLRGFKAREGGQGLDAALDIEYTAAGGRVALTGSTAHRDEHASSDAARHYGKVLDLSSSWKGNLLDKVRGVPNAALDLDAEFRLDRFPLAYVTVLSDRSVRGPLSCKVSLAHLGRDAKLDATIDGHELKIAQGSLGKLDISAKTGPNQLEVKVDLGQADRYLRAELSTPIKWGAELAPSVDPHAKIKLAARRFPLSTASPLLLDYVSAIEGDLDANFDVELGESAPKMQGTATVGQGVVQIPQIGQRLAQISAKVSVQPDGRVKLDTFEARGTSGRITANAEAAIKGTELASLKAHAEIKKKEKLPITYEGAQFGEAWGKIDFSLAQRDGKSEMRVDVPEFRMELPAAMSNVQDLAPDEHVRIGVYQRDGKFTAVAAQPLKQGAKTTSSSNEPPSESTVRVRLGNAVWIERGTEMKVQLAGEISMTSGGEATKFGGRIELRGGKLDVSGKTFDIETGVVSFDEGTPDNPTITATARWDSPAGYTVYAQYSGTAKAGKLTLRAEPPLSQAEIVSLLLFGDPEGSVGGGQGKGGAAAAAVGAAGGSAVKGFNRVMGDFTHLDVAARIDTSHGDARPELVVQVTPALATKVSRAVGEPGPNESPDRTFLTLEFRLMRAWALSAVVGDRGASQLDLIWRKRY